MKGVNGILKTLNELSVLNSGFLDFFSNFSWSVISFFLPLHQKQKQRTRKQNK